MMLTDKVAVIYGAGGGIGGAVARAFAARGVHRLPHRAHPGAGRGRRQGGRVRRRIGRGGGGRRPRRAGRGRASPIGDRDGGPRRHLGQRGRHPERGDPGRAPGRPGRRAVPAADHRLRDVVLPDRAPGRAAHDPEPIRGDHDRHRTARADRPPAGRWLRPGAGGQGGAHPGPVRRARAARHPRGRPAAAGHAGDPHDQGRLRAPGRGIRPDLGTVAGPARQQDPPAPAHDAGRRWRTRRRSWPPTGRAG